MHLIMTDKAISYLNQMEKIFIILSESTRAGVRRKRRDVYPWTWRLSTAHAASEAGR